MRDPMSWALPVFRAFGIPVKIHVLFFLVTLGLFAREVREIGDFVWWGDIFLLTVVVLFLVILLHEFGHCFGARSVGGDAKEVLIWPLGGLAFMEVPHTPRANFIATAAGPAVNLGICVLCALLLGIAGFYPSLNPFARPYEAKVHNYRDGRTYTSSYGNKFYRTGTAEEVTTAEDFKRSTATTGTERALSPLWVTWTYRIFWLNWFLFLFNLLPAYPLDGGQLLQAVIWARSDYRRGMVVACYSGYAVSILFLALSIFENETLLMGLGLFMLYTSWMKLQALDTEDSPFGYDFSAGYTSLERDEPPVRAAKRPGFFARWQAARRARKLQREHEQRQQDDEKMDQILEKIARTGKESLSDDERRFLERVSARFRNRS